MGLIYQISRWHSATAPQAADYAERKQGPAAKRELRRMVHEMLAADGLLDRPIAYDLMRQVEFADIRPPAAGHIRKQEFRLRDELGPFVHIWVQRIPA